MNTGAVSPSEGTNTNAETTSSLNALGGGDFKIRTLGDMKQALIEKMGPEEGQKYFDKFTTGMFITMLNSMRQTADHALAEQKRQRKEMGG